MRELLAHSVAVWESDPRAFAYNPVGYLQISAEVMHADVAAIAAEQVAIGYPSTFVEGEAACRAYLQNIFPDWRAGNITNVLHEQPGGYANNRASLRGLTAKAEAAGVQIRSGVRMTGVEVTGCAVTGVQTDAGQMRS